MQRTSRCGDPCCSLSTGCIISWFEFAFSPLVSSSTLTPLWIYVIFIHELLMCSAAAAPCLCLWFWSLPASSGNNNLLYSMSCKEVNQYLAVCGHGVIWSSLNVDRYPNTDNLSCRYSGLTQLSRCM